MAASPPTVVVPMPQLGVSVEEGTVTAWHKTVGDQVAADEPLCDITTDKVDTEVLSPEAGVLARVLAEVGETVKIGTALAELAIGEAAIPAAGVADGAAAEVTVDQAPPDNGASVPPPSSRAAREVIEAVQLGVAVAGEGSRVVASPLARRLAADHGVSIEGVSGTGRGGRIRKVDVMAAVQHAPAPAVSPASDAPAETAVPPTPNVPPLPGAPAPTPAPPRPGSVVAPTAEVGLPRGYQDVPHTISAISNQRRAIAEHMVRSRHTAAHMTTEVEVDMSAVSRARVELNAARAAAGVTARLSYLALIARATCVALQRYPVLNATFAEGHIIHWSEINLGIAVDTPAGLLVPVIRSAERLTAGGIGDAIVDLAARARERRLTPDDMRAGTFTISNPGSVGAVSAMAIINQPQVAILGTPAIVRKPVVVTNELGDESIAIRPMMLLALTFDHRAVDGAEATRCLVQIKDHLEGWGTPAYA